MTPDAKGGFMPQVYEFEDERVKTRVRLLGVRRFFLLKWLPFLTESKPKIGISISLKTLEFKVEDISVDCEAPKKEKTYLYPDDYGRCLGKLETDGREHRVTFPVVDRSGLYEYHLHVRMSYKRNGNTHEISSFGKIMSTGNVPYVENFTMYVVSAICGAGLTLLTQWLIRCIFDGG